MTSNSFIFVLFKQFLFGGIQTQIDGLEGHHFEPTQPNRDAKTLQSIRLSIWKIQTNILVGTRLD